MTSGEFSRPGRRDWAVLCQIGSQASLLVYIEGSAKPAVLATGSFDEHPRSEEEARGIRTVNWDYVARHNPGLKVGVEPKACVEDGQGMGSSIYCYLSGKWAKLIGAD